MQKLYILNTDKLAVLDYMHWWWVSSDMLSLLTQVWANLK